MGLDRLDLWISKLLLKQTALGVPWDRLRPQADFALFLQETGRYEARSEGDEALRGILKDRDCEKL